jgi:Fe-S-cluster containining protein
MDCSCDRCQNFCRHKPGWFTPEQIEPLARKLNLRIDELFQKYLTIDAVLIEERGQMKAVYVLAPAIIGKKSGAISDPSEKGPCVWLKDGACEIHGAKPRECGLVDHSTTTEEGNLLRASLLKRWIPYKGFVQQLYGKKLKAPDALKKAYRGIKRQRELAPPPRSSGT